MCLTNDGPRGSDRYLYSQEAGDELSRMLIEGVALSLEPPSLGD